MSKGGSVRSPLSSWLRPHVEAVGIEIGTANLKLVELGGSPPALRAYATRPTPSGAIQEGNIVEPAAVAAELREMLAEARTRNRYAVTAISNISVITRIIQIPRMTKKELEETIRWESERYIPFPIDEVVLDHALLEPENTESEQMDVVIAAARNETVAGLVETLKEARLEPVVIDVKPFAGLRPIRNRLMADEGDIEPITLYLEIGAESSSLVLLRGERLLMNRNLSISGHNFTEAIAKGFNLDNLAAEEAKQAYGFATMPAEDEEVLLNLDTEQERFNPARMYDAVRPVLVDLTTELRRSLEFFSVQIGDLSVDQGFITGGGSRLRGLPDIVGEVLGVQLEPIDPWRDIVIDEHLYSSAEVRAQGLEFTVPVGLAMRGIDPFD